MKIIKVNKPSECDWIYRKKLSKETICNNPDGPDLCPDNDEFPTDCPLEEKEAAEMTEEKQSEI